MRLKDRVAIITGSAQGIGRAFAERFAREGAVVILADINEEKLEHVKETILTFGGMARAHQVDVTDEESVVGVVEKVMGEFGRIDILLNNAAYFSKLRLKPFWEIPSWEWDAVMAVNLRGTFYCAKAVVPYMQKNGKGKIINISSVAPILGRPGYLHYSSSKAGLIGFTKSLAREVGSFGINVNAIVPGPTFTEIQRETLKDDSTVQDFLNKQCFKRKEVPEDLVGTAVFLAGDDSDFITGQVVVVDGGLT